MCNQHMAALLTARNPSGPSQVLVLYHNLAPIYFFTDGPDSMTKAWMFIPFKKALWSFLEVYNKHMQKYLGKETLPSQVVWDILLLFH